MIGTLQIEIEIGIGIEIALRLEHAIVVEAVADFAGYADYADFDSDFDYIVGLRRRLAKRCSVNHIRARCPRPR